MNSKALLKAARFLRASYPTHAYSLPSDETVVTSQEHLVPHPKEITMKSNSRFMKTAVATGLIVVTGAAALGITSFASAQVADQPTAVVVAVDDTATPSTDVTTPAADATTPAADVTTPATDSAPYRMGKHMGGHKGGPGKFSTEGLATVLKLTAEELKTELKAGKSLAAIAEAQNVDIADVKSQLTTDFKAHLAEEVTAGKHTQAEADAKLEKFTARLDDMVNRVRPVGGPMGGHKGRGMGDHREGHRGGYGHDMNNEAPTAQSGIEGTNASFSA